MCRNLLKNSYLNTFYSGGPYVQGTHKFTSMIPLGKGTNMMWWRPFTNNAHGLKNMKSQTGYLC